MRYDGEPKGIDNGSRTFLFAGERACVRLRVRRRTLAAPFGGTWRIFPGPGRKRSGVFFRLRKQSEFLRVVVV